VEGELDGLQRIFAGKEEALRKELSKAGESVRGLQQALQTERQAHESDDQRAQQMIAALKAEVSKLKGAESRSAQRVAAVEAEMAVLLQRLDQEQAKGKARQDRMAALLRAAIDDESDGNPSAGTHAWTLT